ncbi:hypothetical protein ACFSJY_09030 [Thalassotalea euphylliae]|uniref:hypothetical protein n=1 Tax=Thalassotalea euphylliae TaxID=1655234 RepID=UPI00363117FB
MQVNNSNLSTQVISNQQQVTPQQQNQQVAERERLQNDQQNSREQQRVNRISIDQNAIAVLDRDREAQQRNNTTYDAPSQRNSRAIGAYQTVDNLERKDSVQQLLGVDIYA